MSRWLSILLLCWAAVASATTDVRSFDTPEHETRYRELIEELRCTVCQNQNIADSNAELATDLREKTYRMVMAGKSKQEIKDYMVARYGNFVLYDPPFSIHTLLLWIGPFLFLVFGAFLVIRVLRRRARSTVTVDEAQRRRAAELLDGKEDPDA